MKPLQEAEGEWVRVVKLDTCYRLLLKRKDRPLEKLISQQEGERDVRFFRTCMNMADRLGFSLRDDRLTLAYPSVYLRWTLTHVATYTQNRDGEYKRNPPQLTYESPNCGESVGMIVIKANEHEIDSNGIAMVNNEVVLGGEGVARTKVFEHIQERSIRMYL